MKKIIKKILEIFRLLNLYYKIEDLVNPLKKKIEKIFLIKYLLYYIAQGLVVLT